jgi:hypothetical protein
MREVMVIIAEVIMKNPFQMALIDHNDMIKAFPPDRFDDGLARHKYRIGQG